MMTICILNLGIIISIISSVIALLAFITTYLCVRYQLLGLILNQLADKARECNSNLNQKNQVPEEANKASGLVTSIIKANSLLNYHLKHRRVLLLFLNRQSCVDQFYLQLHTSVLELLFTIGRFVNLKTDPSPDESVNEQIKIDIQCQLKKCITILNISHERDKKGDFENK